MGASRHSTFNHRCWLSRPSVSLRTKGALLVVAGFCSAGTQAQPQFSIKGVGPTDEEYVSSNPRALNDVGQVAQLAYRSKQPSTLGSDAWLFDGTNTVRLGLTGPGYERSDGYRNTELGADPYTGSVLRSLNDAGQVVGRSSRFNGSSGTGSDVWLYNGTSTVQLGFTGPGYERNDGVRINGSDVALNEAGQVVGYSLRYNRGENAGADAWLFDGTNTLRLGLGGLVYERADGCRTSYANDLNDGGQAAGTSKRYNHFGVTACDHRPGDLGQDVWLFDGTNTVRLGFTGTGYERPDGHRISILLEGNGLALNQAGHVAGSSERYDVSGDNKGHDAWLYNGTDLVQIGLIGTGYESITGTRYSQADVLNESGQVAGVSIRSAPLTYGIDAWFYDGTKTIRIDGLTGDPYDSEICGPRTEPRFLNESGHVAGTAYHVRRTPPNDEQDCLTDSEDAWLFDGTSTKPIGLTGSGFGANYASSRGERGNYVRFLNDAGQAAGETFRYSGTEYRGQDAWVYDSASGKTYTINLSTRPSDGNAISYITHLDENGNAVGAYFQYDQMTGDYLGNRAFFFSLAEGKAYVLEDLVAGDIAAHGWSYLEEATRSNKLGQIIGFGELTTGGKRAFLLTPSPVTRACTEGPLPVVCPVPDLNGDGSPDMAAVLAGAPRVEIRSGADGTLIRTMPVLDDAHVFSAAEVIADTDGEGVQELAVLAARSSDVRPIVAIQNLDGSGSARSISFAPGYTAVALALVTDDAYHDGNAELAVLSARNSDRRGVIEIRNALDGLNVNTFWVPADLTPHDVEMVPDADNNGVPEVALLATRVSDGSPLVRVWNADGSGTPYTRVFRVGQRAIDLAVIPDKDADGVSEIAVLSSRDSDGRFLVEVKNAWGPTNHFQYWLAPGLTGVALEALTPADGSAVPEIAVLARRESDDRILVTVRNAFGTDTPRSIPYTVGYTPLGLAAFPDTNGNAEEETGVIMSRDSDGRILMQRRDVLGTPNPRNVWFAPSTGD
jgi:hypothetical protein